MSESASKRAALERGMKLLKDEEARFRYLVTSNKTSPEYRKEASAKLEEVRRGIYWLSCEMAMLENAEE